MRIRWTGVKRTDEPGLHRLADGREVQVSAGEIARWRSDPEGAFDAFWYAGEGQRPALLTLTDFHPAPEAERADA